MNKQEVIEVLTNYNKWRRGDDESIPQPRPKDIGEAIDAAIAHLSTTEGVGDGDNAKRYLFLRARLQGNAYREIGVIYSEGMSGIDAAIDQAIAATEGNNETPKTLLPAPK